MSDFPGDSKARASRYAAIRGESILLAPACGLHGDVIETTRGSILKVFGRWEPFDLELRVYERLQAAGAVRIRGFTIPVLIDADPRLGVLELSRVEPPYVLDFASVTIDETPEEKWADQPGRMQAARARAEDSFADHTREQWAEVEALYEAFGERFGVWMLDLHPGNIAFDAPFPPAAG